MSLWEALSSVFFGVNCMLGVIVAPFVYVFLFRHRHTGLYIWHSKDPFHQFYAFPGNKTHDLGVVSTMRFCLVMQCTLTINVFYVKYIWMLIRSWSLKPRKGVSHDARSIHATSQWHIHCKCVYTRLHTHSERTLNLNNDILKP